MSAPVGQACWHGAVTQCLHTSLIMSQAAGIDGSESGPDRHAVSCSMNFTCRQEVADSSPVLS